MIKLYINGWATTSCVGVAQRPEPEVNIASQERNPCITSQGVFDGTSTLEPANV